MKDTIYLIVGREKVEGFRKTMPDLKRNQIPVKLTIEVDEKAFGTPVVEKHVFVNDWTKGIDIEDVRFEKNVITDEEAALIREKRLAKMKQILEEQGYEISEPVTEDLEEE